MLFRCVLFIMWVGVSLSYILTLLLDYYCPSFYVIDVCLFGNLRGSIGLLQKRSGSQLEKLIY